MPSPLPATASATPCQVSRRSQQPSPPLPPPCRVSLVVSQRPGQPHPDPAVPPQDPAPSPSSPWRARPALPCPVPGRAAQCRRGRITVTKSFTPAPQVNKTAPSVSPSPADIPWLRRTGLEQDVAPAPKASRAAPPRPPWPRGRAAVPWGALAPLLPRAAAPAVADGALRTSRGTRPAAPGDPNPPGRGRCSAAAPGAPQDSDLRPLGHRHGKENGNSAGRGWQGGGGGPSPQAGRGPPEPDTRQRHEPGQRWGRTRTALWSCSPRQPGAALLAAVPSPSTPGDPGSHRSHRPLPHPRAPGRVTPSPVVPQELLRSSTALPQRNCR